MSLFVIGSFRIQRMEGNSSVNFEGIHLRPSTEDLEQNIDEPASNNPTFPPDIVTEVNRYSKKNKKRKNRKKN
jgi:hypothetical protein